MATGALDANGIWIYGEDDSEPTFSGLLNKLGDSTSDAIGTINTDITALEGRAISGLVMMKPTAITATSGSGSVTTLGQVNFTTVTSIKLDGVFTSAYDNYRFVFKASTSAVATLSLNFRTTGGADITAANYNQQLFAGTTTTVVASGATAQTSAFMASTQAAAVQSFSGDIWSPFLAEHTTGSQSGTRSNSSVVSNVGFSLQNTTVAGGLSINISSGNMTGSLSVYAYND